MKGVRSRDSSDKFDSSSFVAFRRKGLVLREAPVSHLTKARIWRLFGSHYTRVLPRKSAILTLLQTTCDDFDKVPIMNRRKGT